jgi:transcriptional regulator with XRE-family HTH domain
MKTTFGCFSNSFLKNYTPRGRTKTTFLGDESQNVDGRAWNSAKIRIKMDGCAMDLHEIENHIGKQIKLLRLSRKISQKALAKQMGITYQQVQKYENGLNKISVSRLWQICDIFDISPNFLFENILDESQKSKKSKPLIPNSLATSQDMKLMLAFKKIDDSAKRALMIKLCQAMASDEKEDETYFMPSTIEAAE